MAETSDNDQGSSDVKLSTRRRRKKSLVWEHFTVERVDSECRRACCKRCKQTFAYSSGSKCSGTSHLKRHLTSGSCPRNQRQLSPYTLSPKDGETTDQLKKRHRGNTSAFYNLENSRVDIAKMIIMHDYELHMVEHPAFVTFVQNLQPHFNMVTFSTVEADCLAIYLKEKQNLKQLLSTLLGRVSLTLDLWTSSRTLAYLSVTGQYIDNNWKLRRRILNFMALPSYSGSSLTDAIWTCLSDWNMENRLFTLAFDDYTLNDSIGANLKDHLSNKNVLVLGGQLFVSSCFARVLNLTAQDGLKAIHETIYEVRESIKYVKSSQVNEEKFAEVIQQLQIASTKSLSLDVHSQWNTTYLMLLAAIDYKEAFSCLQTCDPSYNNRAPSEEGWMKVENLCKHLKVLYDVANVFAGRAYPTANLYFHEAWKIKYELMHAAASEDAVISGLTKQMHERFDKYWKDCSLVLAVIVAMDPRFKMKLVEFSYSKIYGEDASTFIKIVNDCLHELYLEYAVDMLPLTPVCLENGPDNSTKEGTPSPNNDDDGLHDFDLFISETSGSQRTQTELDQYLNESVLPRIQDFDILDWWKLNKVKYPKLSKMARDLLTIPISTVTSEFMFSSSGKVLDDYHSSLRPETLQALICAKDWLHTVNAAVEEPSNAIVKMEF